MSDFEVPEHRKAWSIYEKELPHYGDRNKVPSVSQLIAWKFGAPPDVPNVWIAMDRGSKVHWATQLFDEGDLHLPSIQGTELVSYVKAWMVWVLGNMDAEPFIAIEKPLYGTLAGIDFIVKPDRVMRRDGEIWIVDIKTKSRSGRMPTINERANHALGAAAQYVAVAQRTGLEAHVRGCLYLWPDKAEFVRYGEPKAIDLFAQLLMEWKEAQGEAEQSGAGVEEDSALTA